MYHLYVTTDIYRICQIFVARFRIWGGLSNAVGRLSLQKPPRGAGAAKNGGLPLTLTVALTTGQHYRAACDH